MHKQFQYAAVFLICMALLFIVGCIQTNNNSSQSIQSSTSTISETSVTSTMTSLSSSEWSKYTSTEDHFIVNIPPSWRVTEIDMSNKPSFFLNNVSVSGVKLTPMKTELIIISPASDVGIKITGETFSKVDSSISDTDIITGFVKALIPSIEQSMFGGAQTMDQQKEFDGQQYQKILPSSYNVQIDPKIYNVNGFSVQRFAINPLDANGMGLVHMQIYVFQKQNTLYIMQDTFGSNAPSFYNTTDSIIDSFNLAP